MRKLKERTNKGYEIVCYHPKNNGRYTADTGNIRCVYQTDDVMEVAAWFAKDAWARCFEDSDYACPTTYLDGVRFPALNSELDKKISDVWSIKIEDED